MTEPKGACKSGCEFIQTDARFVVKENTIHDLRVSKWVRARIFVVVHRLQTECQIEVKDIDNPYKTYTTSPSWNYHPNDQLSSVSSTLV